MHHDTPLISTIVAGLVLAFIFGMIANRFKLPPLVGYLFAGILVGPHTPGFIADQALGAELAELGVILLMFGVGLHFSLKDLMSVRALAIPGALVQIGFASLLGLGLGLLLGWDVGAGLLFGLALSVASTVVLLKALQDRRLIETERGRIAVGWLIVEDIAMVLALVMIPAIASMNGAATVPHDPFVSFVERVLRTDVGIWGALALTLVKLAAFVGFMLIVGRRFIPWALHITAHTGSRELFRLAVLAIALGVALGSAVLFGVSLALGAFFAGMILSESELSHRAAQETLPLRDAFAVLFFVSVGMLFDPAIIITDPLPVLATVFIIVIGKSVAAFGIVLLFRRPVSTALTISASLAQIGEFSFILAGMGVALAILPPEGQDLILAGALISIVLNPVVFWVLDLAKPRLEAKVAQRLAARYERDGVRVEPTEGLAAANGPITTDAPSDAAIDRGALGADDDTDEPSTKTGHTVLVGYGQVGRIVAAGLKAEGGDVVVIEDSDGDVAAARAEDFEVVFGNAANEDVLKLANLGAARNLLVAISNAFEAGSVCESGRKLNAGISIVARAYSEQEETFLRNLGATTVIRGEREIGKGILSFLHGEGRDAVSPVRPAAADPKPEVFDSQAETAATDPAAIVSAGLAAGAVDAARQGEPDGSPDAVMAKAGTDGSPDDALAADPVVIAAVEAAVPLAPAADEEATTLEPIAVTPAAAESPSVVDRDPASGSPEPAEAGAASREAGPAEVEVAPPEVAADPKAEPARQDVEGEPPAGEPEAVDADALVAGTPAEEATTEAVGASDSAPEEPARPMPEGAAGSGEGTGGETGHDSGEPTEAAEQSEDKPAAPPVVPEPKD